MTFENHCLEEETSFGNRSKTLAWQRTSKPFLEQLASGPYRGTSLIRNSALLGPYGRTMHRALRWVLEGGRFRMSEVTLYSRQYRRGRGGCKITSASFPAPSVPKSRSGANSESISSTFLYSIDGGFRYLSHCIASRAQDPFDDDCTGTSLIRPPPP